MISTLSKGLTGVFSSTTVQRHQFFSVQPFYCPAFTCVLDYWKNESFDSKDFCQQSSNVFLSHFIPYGVMSWPLMCGSVACVAGGPKDVSFVNSGTFWHHHCGRSRGHDSSHSPPGSFSSLLSCPSGCYNSAVCQEVALFLAEIVGVNPAPAYGGSSSLPTAFFEMCPGFTV